jgi:hypothetical protein
MEKALDNILSDFEPNVSEYPISTLLMVFEASSKFNPSLLRLLAKQLTGGG